MDKVSIIIPSYNRFEYLLQAIESVKIQTYKNIEIIIINDGSSEKAYYEYDFSGVNIIHLEKNTKEIFGYSCVGYVINVGISKSSGNYIAFLDDDDVWFPNKLQLQIDAMNNNKCKMSCTDGYIGYGKYDPNKKYLIYNNEKHYNTISNKFKKKGSNLLDNGFPIVWDRKFLEIHNCIIASSCIIHKDIIDKIGNQDEIKMGGVMINNTINHIDYNYWLKALEYTTCVYVKDICIYYNEGHAAGQLWK